MVEHSAVNRRVVGSSPTRGVNVVIAKQSGHGDAAEGGVGSELRERQKQGSVVKRLRHRPFTAVTRVRFSSESLVLFLDSSAVEHPAVNRRVVGSNPTRGVLYLVR